MKNLYQEIMKATNEIYPELFDGNPDRIGEATGHIADALGSMFTIIGLTAPNQATAQEAINKTIERALLFSHDVKQKQQ
ncbi:hypothetical protein [Methylobacterium sp. Leaf466]|uniref:hypothetical protein n=1 Tax=Methylobacterium sp. Leaf466 TaxID=1736386 RepID=UPI000A8CB92C|nr:hypothetical protein [Methylobacterium sp. Leaf466]